jgi:cell division protein FtsB
MKPKKKPLSFIIGIGLTVFVVYASITLVNAQVRLAERKQELELLQARHEVIRLEGRELDRRLAMANDMTHEDIERIAREQLDYVAPDQRVFIDISGR